MPGKLVGSLGQIEFSFTKQSYCILFAAYWHCPMVKVFSSRSVCSVWPVFPSKLICKVRPLQAV